MKVFRPKPFAPCMVEKTERGARLVPSDMGRWRALLREHEGQPVHVVFEKPQDKRSIYANNYWWFCLGLVEKDTGNKKDYMHEICLKKFLSKQKVEIISPVTGECEIHAVQERSSTQRISDFYDFVEEARVWFVEFFGVITPDPDPEYWRKRPVSDRTRRRKEREDRHRAA